MDQSPWVGNIYSDSQTIPCILWNTEVHYRFHISPSPVLILNPIKPFHASYLTSWNSMLILWFLLCLGLPSGLIPSLIPSNESNLSLTTYLATVLRDSALCRVLTFHMHVKKHHSKFKNFEVVRNIERFYLEELLGSRSTSKLEDHHLSVIRNCLPNVFAATLHL